MSDNTQASTKAGQGPAAASNPLSEKYSHLLAPPKPSYTNMVAKPFRSFNPPGSQYANLHKDFDSANQIFRSYSANAIVADFSGHLISMPEITNIISATKWPVETMRFLKAGRAAELCFLSSSDLQRAINEGITYKSCDIPLSRCFGQDSTFLSITIKDLPCRSTADTQVEISRVLQQYSKPSCFKFPVYPNSNIRTDTCSVLLDISLKPSVKLLMPRQIRLFGAPCEIW